MKINIHAGHNPDGLVGCGAIGFIKESTEARKVVKEVIRQLTGLGHTVYDCTCNDGTSQTNVLTKVVDKCNKNTVDIDISIHFNAGVAETKANGKTSGTEVLLYRTGSEATKYADGVLSAISSLGFKNRKIKIRPDLYYLRATKSPAMLIECCFVDDKDDVELYDYKKMATAIVKGITGKTLEKEQKVKSIYRVQVGAYESKEIAEKTAKRLINNGFSAIIIKG